MINFFPFCSQVENIYNYTPPNRFFFFKLMVESGIFPGKALGNRSKKKKKSESLFLQSSFQRISVRIITGNTIFYEDLAF